MQDFSSVPPDDRLAVEAALRLIAECLHECLTRIEVCRLAQPVIDLRHVPVVSEARKELELHLGSLDLSYARLVGEPIPPLYDGSADMESIA